MTAVQVAGCVLALFVSIQVCNVFGHGYGLGCFNVGCNSIVVDVDRYCMPRCGCIGWSQGSGGWSQTTGCNDTTSDDTICFSTVFYCPGQMTPRIIICEEALNESPDVPADKVSKDECKPETIPKPESTVDNCEIQTCEDDSSGSTDVIKSDTVQPTNESAHISDIAVCENDCKTETILKPEPTVDNYEIQTSEDDLAF